MNTNEITKKRVAIIALSVLIIYVMVRPLPAPQPPQTPPSQPVTVLNTTANPVPVVQQGALTLSGTPNVNVANSAASPVLVRSVDSGAAQPVMVLPVVQFSDSGNVTPVYTVPIGKRLVIEYVSMEFTCPAGQHPLIPKILTSSDSPIRFGYLPIPLQFSGRDLLGEFDFFAGGSLVKAYVEPGGTVSVSIARDSTAGFVDYSATVSGYLINVP